MDYQEYLKRILNAEEIEKLNSCYLKESIGGVRVNLLKIDSENFRDFFPMLKKHPFVPEGFIFDKSSIRLGKDPLHYAGAYYIQEPSAMMVVHLLNVKEHDKVLDLCAAPGGKSSHVLSHLKGTGILVSNDISYKRAQVLSENIERMGADNAFVLCEEISKIEDRFYGFFDKVILDAPCSGQGMFRKNDEVYKDWTYNKTLSLANTNKELIMQAYNCLKKGGTLVYSTCTFTKEENEDVVNFLLENTNASIIKIPLNSSFYSSSIEGAIRLYPFAFEGEGHFICLIKCNDEHNCSLKNGINKVANKKDIEIYREFEKNNLNIHLEGDFIKMGDELHLIKNNCFCLNDLKVLRNGVHLGTIKKDRFEPNHSLAMCLSKQEAKRNLDFDHLSKDALTYLKGMTLETLKDKGYVLISINGISVGWGKDDGRIIKNLYPKGLRMN